MLIERSIVAAVAAVALLTAGACADDDDRGATPETTTPDVGYICSSPAAPAVTSMPVQVVGAGVCGYDDGLGEVTYGVVVRNTGDETLKDLSLAVDVRGDGGIVAGRSVPHYVYVLAPGEELGVGYRSPAAAAPEGLTLGVRVDQMEVVDEPEADAQVTVSDVSTAVQGNDRTTTFTATSTYPFPLLRVEVYVVYRDAAGAIVGGEQHLIDRMEVQGTAAHTVTSDYLNPTVTRADVYVSENPAYPWE